MLVEVKKPRRRIEVHLSPRSAILGTCEAVCPWMKQRNACGATLSGGGLEVFDAPQDLHVLVAKRGAEHPVAGQKDSLEVARNDSVSGWVLE
jgi:hypothetical protein